MEIGLGVGSPYVYPNSSSNNCERWIVSIDPQRSAQGDRVSSMDFPNYRGGQEEMVRHETLSNKLRPNNFVKKSVSCQCTPEYLRWEKGCFLEYGLSVPKSWWLVILFVNSSFWDACNAHLNQLNADEPTRSCSYIEWYFWKHSVHVQSAFSPSNQSVMEGDTCLEGAWAWHTPPVRPKDADKNIAWEMGIGNTVPLKETGKILIPHYSEAEEPSNANTMYTIVLASHIEGFHLTLHS